MMATSAMVGGKVINQIKNSDNINRANETDKIAETADHSMLRIGINNALFEDTPTTIGRNLCKDKKNKKTCEGLKVNNKCKRSWKMCRKTCGKCEPNSPTTAPPS